MGSDSIAPFIVDKSKGAFVLCRTSNGSAKDLQDHIVNGQPLYEHVAQMIKDLNTLDNVGLVSRDISFKGDMSEDAIHRSASDYVEQMRKVMR